ncbi:MAG: hypothetical protein ABFE07_13430 [Armatimonadia bacterium]
MSIGEFLAWLVGSGGIGWLCSQLIDWLRDHWFAFAALRPDLLRLASFGITALVATLLGAGAIWLSAWLGYDAAPGTAQAWVERLFAIASAAIIAGQVRHGEMALKGGDA